MKSHSKQEQTCFVISPIGKDGTETYKKFKNVFEYVIKPAIESSSDYKLKVIRADNIERPGSFIRDILEQLLNSFIVIADLTDQNPNVFYELGVRHALSPRTILIAQDVSYIPSDLREYRTIVYEDSAKGVTVFKEKLLKYLKEIYSNPIRPDNPVLDRIGSLITKQTTSLEQQIQSLTQELNNLLQKGYIPIEKNKVESIFVRINRILELNNAELSLFGKIEFPDENNKIKVYEFPEECGEFKLHTLLEKDGSISEYWYIASIEKNVPIDNLLADIRVLLRKISNLDVGSELNVKFIIATNESLKSQKRIIIAKFKKMKALEKSKTNRIFSIEVWDKDGLHKKELEQGLIIDDEKL